MRNRVQIFKAVTEDQIAQMRSSFRQQYDRAKSDDFYCTALEAKRHGQATFTLDKSLISAKPSGDDPVNYDLFAALGSVRLRHSATGQPLVPGDVDFDFSLPFEKTSQIVEEFWNFLLQLEDLSRQQGQRQKVNDCFRHIVHTLQLDTSMNAAEQVDPARHQRLAFYLNDAKGQTFLIRFIEYMPSGSLKKFFFVAFAVFQDAAIDPRSKFASFFLQKLTKFLLEGVKPKWIAAYIRQAAARGFLPIAADAFGAACAAALLKTAVAIVQGADEEGARRLRAAADGLAEKIAADLKDVIRSEYNRLFMNAIVRSVLLLSPASPLGELLVATGL
jgi:hypothetical protein